MNGYQHVDRNIYFRKGMYHVSVERRKLRQVVQRSFANFDAAIMFRNKTERLLPKSKPGAPRIYVGETKNERMNDRYRKLKAAGKCTVCHDPSPFAVCLECRAIRKLKRENTEQKEET